MNSLSVSISSLPGFRPKTGWALFWALFGFYAVTQCRSNWDFAWDGYCRYVMMETVLKTGKAEVKGIPHFYPMFHAGASLAMTPLFLAGEAIERWTKSTKTDYGAEACFFFYSLATAATAVVLARILERMGITPKRALMVALAYGIGSMAWPYAGEMQTEPLVTLCLLAAFEALLAYREQAQGECLTRAGLAISLAILTRPESAILATPLLLYYAIASRIDNRSWRYTLKRAVWLGLMIIPGCLGVLGWNYLRFGSVWDNGYQIEGQQVRFNTPLLTGIFGQLFSSGKGIFWYSPILWIALLGWPAWARQHRLEAWTSGLFVMLAVGLYSKFWNWGGDASWGPRYMLIPLPFALLPLSHLDWSGWKRPARLFALGTLAVSVWVQVLGVFVPIRPDYAYKGDPEVRGMEVALKLQDDNDVLIHYLPQFSPLALHAQRWNWSQLSTRWFPLDRQVHPVGVLLIAIGLIGALKHWSIVNKTRW